MKIVESILTKNPCYQAGRKITVKGLMLHSVGCSQPKADVFIKLWNQVSYKSACVHGFIDGEDGIIYQILPWDYRGWHCGSGNKGSGNNIHIGIEMCEPSCIRYTAGSNFTCSAPITAKAVVKRTYEAAVELFAMLCEKYNLNPLADGVIIHHRGGSIWGIASSHGDPEHLWEQIEGKWYHFDVAGWMQTGWIKDKGKWYYLKESGEMVSGEVFTIHSNDFGNEIFAFAIDGHMLTQRSSRGVLA